MTVADPSSSSLIPRTAGGAAPPSAAAADDVNIPYDKFHLDNGLTVLVHENRRAPTVTVGVWYRVGSKDEPAGKSGFAHLFEHLMFGGSGNFPGLYMSNLSSVGATNLNGTTNRDRTNYYQTVPTEALDYALFAESDRMGHFYETISQQVLDIQRGVVQNEKRQVEGAPYGLVGERVGQGTYPVGHPYAHTTIGSMQDIQAATLDDVRSWFRTFYGPSNAVLVLAGDIDAATARRKVIEYFGDIPPGPPLARPQSWLAKMSGVRREILEDRVPQARLYMVWNVPEYGQRDVTLLDLAAQVLSSGSSSRLYRRLVHELELASSISAGVSAGTIAGQFSIAVALKNGVTAEAAELAIEEELQKFLSEGPRADEVERIQTQSLAGFIRSLDDVGGIAAMLASNEIRLQRPDMYRRFLQWIREATPDAIRDAARRWLTDGLYLLQVVPFPTLRSMEQGVDRSRAPVIGARSRVTLPPLQQDALSNGVRIVLAERHELPLINVGLMLPDGLICDPGGALGTMSLTARLMTLGAGTRDAFAFSEARRRIGATLAVNAGLEGSGIGLSTIKGQLDSALELFADVVLRPHFSATHIGRERERLLEAIAHEMAVPEAAVSRVQPGLLFERGHPYRRPMSGCGIASQVARLDRDAVMQCHARWIQPHRATLLVVGDISMEQLKPKLEHWLGSWKASGSKPTLAVPAAAAPAGPALYLIDKPDTPQAVIRAATMLPAMEGETLRAVKMMNMVFGGDFSSRLNLNLREHKNWSYGVRSSLAETFGPRPYYVSAPVQIDRTGDSIIEIQRELRRIAGSHPVSPEELDRVRRAELLRFGSGIGSLGGLQGAIELLLRRDRTPEYWASYPERLAALTAASIQATLGEMFHPERMVWIVAGDLQRIEPQLRGLDLGKPQIITADGEALYG